MYESGGQIRLSGHLGILFVLFIVALEAAAFHWYENLLTLPFFAYLGYLAVRAGRHCLRLMRQFLNKFR